jgi:DNA end-binding protein Ku
VTSWPGRGIIERTNAELSASNAREADMRSVWKGSISFGLVAIPIELFAATEERKVAFHQVHADDGGRIRYRRFCTVDGEEVEYSDIAKGYELPDGEVVVLTD